MSNQTQTLKDLRAPRSDACHISIISSDTGPVVKRFRYVDGKIHSEPRAALYRGTARTEVANTPLELHDVISELGDNEALALGVLDQVDQAYRLSTEQLRQPGEIARTKAYFSSNEGLGWGLLDIDTKGLPERTRERLGDSDVIAALFRVVPQLERHSHLIRMSSSAGIIAPGQKPASVQSQHVYFQLEYAPQLPHVLAAIHDLCWLSGLGYMSIAKNGKILDRSLIDKAVAGPERLIFEAPPIVEPPLTRALPSSYLHTATPLSELIAPNPCEVRLVKQKAREEIRAEAELTARNYETVEVDRMSRNSNITRTEAQKIFRLRTRGRELCDDDVIEVGPKIFERVGDFLDRVTDPTPIPCPVEGSEYGLTTAYFYPPDSHAPVARIISFAHGEMTHFSFTRFKKLKGLRWL
jgi:hypothetical protein